MGALANLHIQISDSTVDNIRQRKGIPSAPERVKQTTWRQFLKAHWDGLIAADFFTTEVLCWRGLVTYYTLFGIELRSRLVQVSGTTVSPDVEWMKQLARQLTDAMNGFAGEDSPDHRLGHQILLRIPADPGIGRHRDCVVRAADSSVQCAGRTLCALDQNRVHGSADLLG